MANATATTEMSAEFATPAATREKTSRPNWSVPNQWSPDGRLETRGRVLGDRVVRQEPERGDETEDTEQEHEDDPDETARAAEERPEPVHGPSADPAGALRSCGDVGHAARTRGSMTR